MTIRKMTFSDYEKVYALWKATPGMGMNAVDDSEEGIGRYLRRNPNTCFVSETEAGAIDGVIMAGHDGRRGFIYHTAVALDMRGSGIGRALVDMALQALLAEGIFKVALVAYGTNEIGNGFWERYGFTSRPDLVYRDHALSDALK